MRTPDLPDVLRALTLVEDLCLQRLHLQARRQAWDLAPQPSNQGTAACQHGIGALQSVECLLSTEQEQLAQASSKKAAPHAKPEGAPVFKGVTWSSSNGQWRAQAWDGKKVGQLSSSTSLGIVMHAPVASRCCLRMFGSGSPLFNAHSMLRAM